MSEESDNLVLRELREMAAECAANFAASEESLTRIEASITRIEATLTRIEGLVDKMNEELPR
jgi:hypothetical protein